MTREEYLHVRAWLFTQRHMYEIQSEHTKSGYAVSFIDGETGKRYLIEQIGQLEGVKNFSQWAREARDN